MEALRTKLGVQPSDASTTSSNYGHQTWCDSYSEVVENISDGTVLHLDILPGQVGAYYIHAIEKLMAAPAQERDCISLPVTFGFVTITSDDPVYDAVCEGMTTKPADHYFKDDTVRKAVNESWKTELERAGVLMPDEEDNAPHTPDRPVLVAYLLYHPYKTVDFVQRKGSKNRGVIPMSDRVPAAICGYVQLYSLGFNLEFMPQHPYQHQVLCRRDGKMMLVVAFPHYIDRNSVQRSFESDIVRFFEHMFYWRSGVNCPADLREHLKTVEECDMTTFTESTLAKYRSLLVGAK